jgi:RHS repeat-associated protein
VTARQGSIRRAEAAVFLLFAAVLGETRAEASIPRTSDVDRTPPLASFRLFMPAAAPRAGQISRYVTEDELGNVTHLTDQNGNVLERYDYEGYGKFRIFDPSNTPLTASAYGWTRLFQGREYLPLIDAYDFRARTLWPELGRFGQEDPAHSDPRLSSYQALNGRWSNVTDPTGLYSKDFHFYAVYYLARSAGLRRDRAMAIAWASQYVDDHPGTSASVSNTVSAREQLAAFHFLGNGQNSVKRANGIALQNMARARTRGSLIAIGIALHSLADTFSHEGFSAWWDPLRNSRTNGPVPDVGHGDAAEGGNYPDKPYHDVPKALEAAKLCFEQLAILPDPEGSSAFGRRDWQEISKRISGVFASAPGRVEPGWTDVGPNGTRFWSEASRLETEARSNLWKRLISKDFLEDVRYESILGIDSLSLFEEDAAAQRRFVLPLEGWQ